MFLPSLHAPSLVFSANQVIYETQIVYKVVTQLHLLKWLPTNLKGEKKHAHNTEYIAQSTLVSESRIIACYSTAGTTNQMPLCS